MNYTEIAVPSVRNDFHGNDNECLAPIAAVTPQHVWMRHGARSMSG